MSVAVHQEARGRSDSQLGLRDTPFGLMPDPRYFYPNRMYQATLDQLSRLRGAQTGIMILTGRAGTGKTILLKRLMLNEAAGHCRFVHSEYASLSMHDYLALACKELEVQGEGDACPRNLENFLAGQAASGQKVIFLIDEAHNISLRSLTGLVNWILELEKRGTPVRVIFSGQPELETNLRMAGLGDPRGLSLACLRLQQLDCSETANFIRHRLDVSGAGEKIRFTADAIARIHESAKGIPRVINLICGSALLTARSLSVQEVSRDIVEDVIGTSPIGRHVDYMAEGETRVAEYFSSEPDVADTGHNLRAPGLAREAESPDGSTGNKGTIALAWLAHLAAGLGVVMTRTLSSLAARPLPATGVLVVGLISYGLVTRFSLTPPVGTSGEPRLAEVSRLQPAGGLLLRERYGDDAADHAGPTPAPETYPGSESDSIEEAALADAASQVAIAEADAAPPSAAPAADESDSAKRRLDPEPGLVLVAPEHPDGEHETPPTLSPYTGAIEGQQGGNADAVAVATLSMVTVPEVSGATERPRRFDHVAGPPDRMYSSDEFVASMSPQPPAGTADRAPFSDGIAPGTPDATPALPAPAKRSEISPEAQSDGDLATGPDLTALLQEAEALVAARKYTTPPEANALAVYRKVMQLAPNHPLAVQGMEGIRTQYMQWGGAAEAAQRWSKANYYYGLALMVDPAFGEALAATQRVAATQQDLRKQAARAVAAERRDARDALSARGIEISEQALFDYAEKGDTDLVELLLSAGVPPDRRQSGGWTALMYASIHGHAQIVRLLIQQGASLNLKNEDGTTALIAAASNGHLGAVRELLDNGANIDARNNDGWTPLMYAAWNGQTRVVEELIARHANVDIKNRNNWTAWTAAEDAGHSEILKILKRYNNT